MKIKKENLEDILKRMLVAMKESNQEDRSQEETKDSQIQPPVQGDAGEIKIEGVNIMESKDCKVWNHNPASICENCQDKDNCPADIRIGKSKQLF